MRDASVVYHRYQSRGEDAICQLVGNDYQLAQSSPVKSAALLLAYISLGKEG
jgi:hypothetical protein